MHDVDPLLRLDRCHAITQFIRGANPSLRTPFGRPRQLSTAFGADVVASHPHCSLCRLLIDAGVRECKPRYAAYIFALPRSKYIW